MKFLCVAAIAALPIVSAFTINSPSRILHSTSVSVPASTSSYSSSTSLRSSIDDDISAQLAKARALIEKAKAKIETEAAAAAEQQEGEVESKAESVSVKSGESKAASVIKSTNEEGLFTTDGDLMAELSEAEEWEDRGLLDVFETEGEEESDVSRQLASRDVAASIMNLRMSMQNEDYRKIFDKRNRFIGEENELK